MKSNFEIAIIKCNVTCHTHTVEQQIKKGDKGCSAYLRIKSTEYHLLPVSHVVSPFHK